MLIIAMVNLQLVQGQSRRLVKAIDNYGLGVAATYNGSTVSKVVQTKNLVMRIDRALESSLVRTALLYNKSNYSRIWLVVTYDYWRIARRINEVSSMFLFLCCIKSEDMLLINQIDSMLPCVCSVIDHRWRQNVVRTSVTHSAIASCATFLFLPRFDVICDLLLNRRTAKWNLFVKVNIMRLVARQLGKTLMIYTVASSYNYNAVEITITVNPFTLLDVVI